MPVPSAQTTTNLRERRANVDVSSSRTDRGAVVHKLRRREGPQAAAPAPSIDRPEPAAAPRLEAARAQEPKAAPKVARLLKPEKVSPTLDLRPGEAVLGELRGWTRLRRATLYVTNFRVAMVSFPNRVQWIPHEHIDALTLRAAGKGLRFESTIEMISFETRKRKDIAAMHELAERYGTSARLPGVRFDASLVQEWCDRSQEMWDSHTGQFRLWIRRHPVVMFSALGVFVGAAKILGP